jgi:hypothetical protein
MANQDILGMLLEKVGSLVGKGVQSGAVENVARRTPIGTHGFTPLMIEEGFKSVKKAYSAFADELAQKDPIALESKLNEAMAGQSQAIRQPSQAVGEGFREQGLNNQPPPIDTSKTILENLIATNPQEADSVDTETTDTTQPSAQGDNDFLRRLLMSIGGGLAAAGGNTTLATNLLALEQGREKLKVEGETAKTKFTQDLLMEDFKQNRQDYREQLKASLKEGDFEVLRDPDIFISNVANMVQAFDEVPLKGRGVSLLGSTLAGTLGVGREARAKYDYWSEMLSYNIGGFVAGQLGRGLTENERELIKKASVPKLGGGKGAFMGKIQGVIDSANSVLSKEGKPTLPDARTFLNLVRTGKTDVLRSLISEQTQQGTQAVTGQTSSGNKFRRVE